MKPIRPTHQLIKRMVPGLAVWGVGKMLEIPAVKSQIEKIDDRFFEDRVQAKRSFRRGAKTAVRKNKTLLAAGATAVAVGIGLIAEATKR